MMENTFDMAKTCCGTPFYLSPELCQDMPYSSKADIWVKVFLFVLLTKPLGDLSCKQGGSRKNPCSSANPLATTLLDEF